MFEFYYPEYVINEPTSFFVSLFITLIATFLGFWGAFYISTSTERNQRKNEKEKQRDIYKKRLSHLTNLISNSLDIVDKQLTNYEELAKAIKNAPTEIHMPKMTASTDLHRLQRMDTEGIFLAYNEIINDSEIKLKDYKNIYNTIDFVYLRLHQAMDSNEKHIGFCHRDQMYIKEKVDGLSDELIKIIKTIESYGNGFKARDDYKFLTSWHTKYYELVEKQAILGEIEKEMMLPFGDTLKKEHDRMPYFPVLYDFTLKTLVRFNHLKTNADSFADEMNNMRKEMKESIDKLKEINEKIKRAITMYIVHGG